MKISYKSNGLVLGNYWGGGIGAYKARDIEAPTQEELLTKANQMLEDGSLDDGMGYESLIGAILIITETKNTDIDGEDFSHDNSEIVFIGNLTEEEEDFLNECIY